MIHRLSFVAALACGLAAPSAFAQEPPAAAAAPVATGRCTGLFCDMYYANTPAPVVVRSDTGQPVAVQEAPDPTHLPCRDFICAAFVGRTPDAVPPAAVPVAAPVVEPTKAAKRKRKTHKAVASAEAAKTDVAK